MVANVQKKTLEFLKSSGACFSCWRLPPGGSNIFFYFLFFFFHLAYTGLRNGKVSEMRVGSDSGSTAYPGRTGWYSIGFYEKVCGFRCEPTDNELSLSARIKVTG